MCLVAGLCPGPLGEHTAPQPFILNTLGCPKIFSVKYIPSPHTSQGHLVSHVNIKLVRYTTSHRFSSLLLEPTLCIQLSILYFDIYYFIC